MYTFRRLHKAVSHPHVVQLHSVFEDPNFVYIVLELCRFVCLFAFGWLYNLLFVCLNPTFCLHCHWPLQAHHFYTSPLSQKHVREIFCMLTIAHNYTSPGMEAYVSWYRGGKLSRSLKPDILFTRSIKFSLQTGSVFLWYRGSLIVTHSSISFFFAKEKMCDKILLMQQSPDPNGLQVSAWQQDNPQVDWKSTNRSNYTIL